MSEIDRPPELANVSQTARREPLMPPIDGGITRPRQTDRPAESRDTPAGTTDAPTITIEEHHPVLTLDEYYNAASLGAEHPNVPANLLKQIVAMDEQLERSDVDRSERIIHEVETRDGTTQRVLSPPALAANREEIAPHIGYKTNRILSRLTHTRQYTEIPAPVEQVEPAVESPPSEPDPPILGVNPRLDEDEFVATAGRAGVSATDALRIFDALSANREIPGSEGLQLPQAGRLAEEERRSRSNNIPPTTVVHLGRVSVYRELLPKAAFSEQDLAALGTIIAAWAAEHPQDPNK